LNVSFIGNTIDEFSIVNGRKNKISNPLDRISLDSVLKCEKCEMYILINSKRVALHWRKLELDFGFKFKYLKMDF
jgi:hypothetical protein